MIIVLAASLQAQWSNDPNNNLIVGYGLDPHICSDSAGGCYVTYNYETTWYPQKLAVERLDKYGYKPWGTMRQILGELPEQWQAEIVEDGEGGVMVCYQDNQVIGGTDFTSRVRVQRVDSNGNFLWGQTGVRVTLSETNQGSNLLVSDGEGGCVVVWQYYDEPISMNRINSFGERVWGDSGIVLAPTGTSLRIIRASDGKYYVQVGINVFRINQNGEIINQYSTTLWNIIPDPEGGVVLSGKVGNISNFRLVTQRKDSLGNNLWQEPYVEIADSLGLGSFRVGANNRIINFAWLGTYNGQIDRPCFQAGNLEGNLVYQNKILLSDYPSGTTLIGIISSYYNNTIFSWSISGEINSIFAQMYDTLGNKIWNENGIIVSHPRMTYQQYTTDGNGGFIIGGVINNFTVVAQQVSSYGKLGEIITSVPQKDQEVFPIEYLLEQNFPNPFNPSTIIKYQIPKVETHRDASLQLVKLIVYDVLGNEVATLVNEEKLPGVYEIEFSSSSLASGMYLYKLSVVLMARRDLVFTDGQAGQSFIQTKKMILLK